MLRHSGYLASDHAKPVLPWSLVGLHCVAAALVLEEMAAEKWDMAAAVANRLVKVEPENEAWWINLAYSMRRRVLLHDPPSPIKKIDNVYEQE
jgi:hypothetical protein